MRRGNIREPAATERGGFKERFSVGIGTWGLGADVRRKGKDIAADWSSNSKLCSERERETGQECGSGTE